ncbi:MAG: acylphosphatase [Victivallales bacterium]|nr:acylphosphatase [Victivallales bacterium]
MACALLVKVEGRVTGVGFRYSAMRFAAGLPGLHGYIRNTAYDAVEAWIQGPEAEVARMLEWLRHGPSSALVVRVAVNSVTPRDDLPFFTIQ